MPTNGVLLSKNISLGFTIPYRYLLMAVIGVPGNFNRIFLIDVQLRELVVHSSGGVGRTTVEIVQIFGVSKTERLLADT